MPEKFQYNKVKVKEFMHDALHLMFLSQNHTATVDGTAHTLPCSIISTRGEALGHGDALQVQDNQSPPKTITPT